MQSVAPNIKIDVNKQAWKCDRPDFIVSECKVNDSSITNIYPISMGSWIRSGLDQD